MTLSGVYFLNIRNEKIANLRHRIRQNMDAFDLYF